MEGFSLVSDAMTFLLQKYFSASMADMETGRKSVQGKRQMVMQNNWGIIMWWGKDAYSNDI
jgi:hypothetical protein